MEEAGDREVFWGRGLSTRLLLAMGMHPQFFSKSQLRKCSIMGQQHGIGVEVNLGKGKLRMGPRTYPCVNFWVKDIKDEPNSPSDLLER